jgi:hypothetical protein
MLVTVGLTTIAWLAVTWLTPPEPRRRCTRSTGACGRHGRDGRRSRRGRSARGVASLGGELLNALLGCVLVYAALFGVGSCCCAAPRSAMRLLALSALARICHRAQSDRAGARSRSAGAHPSTS